MENTVLEVTGKNGGKYFTNGNGFYYRIKDKPSNSRWKLSCKNIKCKGTAALLNPDGDKSIIAKLPHSCSPDNLLEETNKLREKILQRCKTELTPSNEIFTEETTKR